MAVSYLAHSKFGPQRPAEPEWIGHAPGLIAELKAEHAGLMRLYAELGEHMICGRFPAMAAALDEFRHAFETHICNENLRFYCHLEQRLADRPAELQVIQRGRAELTAIAREISAFLRKYRGVGVRDTNAKAFLDELRSVGALLVHRVDREEKDLYALYRP